MYDVAIIGAGVVGGMIARELSRYTLKTILLDKEGDVAMGATRANSAIVHAGFDAKVGSLKAKLNVRGSEMMEQVARELGVKYKRNGALVIGFSDEDRVMIEELYTRGVQNGVRELAVLNTEALHAIEPRLSPDACCALYAPTSAIICPYELAIAAIGNAMDNGTELRTSFSVTAIEPRDEGYVIRSDRDSIQARYVINAAGLYSDTIAAMIGDTSFQIHPRRGEYILLDKECGDLISHTVFRTPSKMGKGILLSPTVDGNLLTGPTSQDLDDKSDRSTTAEGFARIIAQSKENVPDVPFFKAITSFCGLRAVGSTGDFIINTPRDGFINVAGIESPGLSSAPAIAEYVVHMLRDGGAVLRKKEDFHAQRASMHAFREASIEEKNAIVRRDPSYGRIVCRCETVSEGEILAAIRQNPKPHDMDGVKRRTRAQMGRCQGGFCTPRIIELLAKELDIPFEQVTKCGGASRMTIEKTKGGNGHD
ncbi:MAG: FAD-dependent oxidoreductase [Clostridia bacterium]|nr:FAD-dependent oxidoreductase [Clostridia bacterium]